jgi:hypothetical protein
MEALRLMGRPPQPEEHGQDCGGRRPRQRRAPPSTRKWLPILSLNAVVRVANLELNRKTRLGDLQLFK